MEFQHTPLSQSFDIEDKQIYFKLDCLQQSGSFKDRGIGHMIRWIHKNETVTKLICSSGGNAGHAVATIASQLNIPVDIYVPKTTLPLMIDKLKQKQANVIVKGDNWNEADSYARHALTENTTYKYIPPFDYPLIWEGHGSIIDELIQDLGGVENMPDTIILSVGGGGLLRGIQLRLEQLQSQFVKPITILAVETEGADSFALSKNSGELRKLDKITSIASSLGALQVLPNVLNSSINTISVVVSDKDAVFSCLQFANQQRILVEPACGASLSLLYCYEKYRDTVLKESHKVVVIVCGGSAVSLELLMTWKEKFQL